jgi:parvulin-like peptidyl-prolyl isomerase
VVAEIGPDKMTVAQFDAFLADEIEQAVNSRMGISDDEKEAMRRRAHQQFADPAARAQQLQQIVATRVLADDARKENLHESKTFRDRLVAVADHILAETHLSQEVSQRAAVTDEDVQNFYAANKDRYSEPASTFIAHIQCDSQEEAGVVLDRIHAGESFDSLVKVASKDAASRDKVGILSMPVQQGSDSLPIFGVNPDLHNKIRSAEAGAVLPDPIKSDRGWHLLKVVSHSEAKEHPFEEVAEQVRRDAALARERAVTEQYLGDLFKRRQVKLYPEVFYGGGAGAKQEQTQ